MDQSKVCSQQRGRDVPNKEKYIPKGENADWIKSTYERRVAYSQQRERDVPKKEKYIPKVENADWIKSTYERRVANRERNKGDHGFRERPNRHWMMVSIQVSVSGSICQFLQILCLL